MTATLKDEPAKADVPAVVRPAPGELKFTRPDDFYHELRRRVDDYFNATGLKRRDVPRMYVKTAVILGWFAASYCAAAVRGADLVDRRPAGFFAVAIAGGDRLQHHARRRAWGLFGSTVAQ